MKKLQFSSIRTNLTFWFLILSLLPLIIAMSITFRVSSEAFEERSYNKLVAIRDLRVEQLNSWLNERKGDLKVFAQNTDAKLLTKAITNSDTDKTNQEEEQLIRDILHNYQKAYNVYEEIYIVNTKTGEIDISTNSANEGLSKKGEPLYTEAIRTDRIFISPIYYSAETGKNILTLSAPLYDDWNINPKTIGVIVANINLSASLYPLLLNSTGLGETGETLIVDKEGLVLNELRHQQHASLQLKITAEPATYALQGKTGIIQSVDYRDVPILAAYTYIPATGWGFVCKEDLSELNEPLKVLRKELILLFILSGFIIIGIVYFVSKSISSPIQSMNRVAQKIGAGDFSIRNKIFSKDELGSLAVSFNKMANIIESKLNIQQGVVDISETMIGRANMREFGTSLLKRLMKITDADMSTFYILNEENAEFEPFASVGANEEMLSSFSAEHPQGEFGNALSTKKIFHLKNIPVDTVFKFKTIAGEAIPREIITIPVEVENSIIALISLVNIRKFSKESLEILKQSWININTSYSNLITNERTVVLAENLSRINQQLEAQKEELQEQSEELQNQAYVLQYNSEELQEQNIELDIQKKQVEAANKLKSEFLSNMSHELRTPLNSIMALSRVLIMQAKEKLNEEENNYLEIVERNGKRLLSLINDILDLSKIEAGKMEMNPTPIALQPFLNIIMENMLSLSEEKGLALNLNIENDLPQIETDEMRLHQVLTNILGNAVKFTEKGSVDISANSDTESVIIKVTDSGIGISEEDLPYIFDEFRQADGTTARQYEGTGLGLAIANKMLTILGGKIEVESKFGKGTTFTLHIPIQWQGELIHTPTKKMYSNASSTKSNTLENEIANSENEKTTIKKRILIVEDNLEAIVQLKSVLEKEHYSVDIAAGGHDALSYIKHTIPDGIILDLMMPEIDGFEVLEKIRSTETTKKIPVLILTAKDLTRQELSRLSLNNIQQLIQKGDIDIKGLLLKVKAMLAEGSKKVPNVLVVEDNKDNMTTIKAILKGKYAVSGAYDGEQGLSLANSLLPDIMLLDISLPKLTGDNIIKQLKTNKHTKNIPVIAVTAQAMKGDKEKFLELGFDGYIPKPISQELLLAEINKLLDGK